LTYYTTAGGAVISTEKTIYIPAVTHVKTISSPVWLPSSVSIPVSEAVVRQSVLSACNQPEYVTPYHSASPLNSVFYSASIGVPATWTSPVAIPASLASLIPSSKIVYQTADSSVVLVNSVDVPSRVPSSVIVSVATSVLVPLTRSSFVAAPGTVFVPSTWSSPVVLPIAYASNIPSSEVQFQSGVAVVSWANVPYTVPSAVVVDVPSTNVASVPTSSVVFAPASAKIPSSFNSPVVVPASWVSNLPSSAVVTISSEHSAVIVDSSYVTFVPSSVVVSLPESTIQWVSVPAQSYCANRPSVRSTVYYSPSVAQSIAL
jgi:hypothetical protein